MSVPDTICELLGQGRATINFHCQAKTLFIVRMTNGAPAPDTKMLGIPLKWEHISRDHNSPYLNRKF